MGDLSKRINCPEMRYFAVAVFIMYQAVSDTFKAFVYFQF
jgi:hypothetical protein